eukprot:Phypoly_transcript_00055.p1 GENE.Phypoly_transcript_00055~~Phypoly_transcript_00055.p1  ORF type:complete len:1209 (+),score=206.72 Phypoly_transcript_00055:1019-4645(+)
MPLGTSDHLSPWEKHKSTPFKYNPALSNTANLHKYFTHHNLYSLKELKRQAQSLSNTIEDPVEYQFHLQSIQEQRHLTKSHLHKFSQLANQAITQYKLPLSPFQPIPTFNQFPPLHPKQSTLSPTLSTSNPPNPQRVTPFSTIVQKLISPNAIKVSSPSTPNLGHTLNTQYTPLSSVKFTTIPHSQGAENNKGTASTPQSTSHVLTPDHRRSNGRNRGSGSSGFGKDGTVTHHLNSKSEGKGKASINIPNSKDHPKTTPKSTYQRRSQYIPPPLWFQYPHLYKHLPLPTLNPVLLRPPTKLWFQQNPKPLYQSLIPLHNQHPTLLDPILKPKLHLRALTASSTIQQFYSPPIPPPSGFKLKAFIKAETLDPSTQPSVQVNPSSQRPDPLKSIHTTSTSAFIKAKLFNNSTLTTSPSSSSNMTPSTLSSQCHPTASFRCTLHNCTLKWIPLPPPPHSSVTSSPSTSSSPHTPSSSLSQPLPPTLLSQSTSIISNATDQATEQPIPQQKSIQHPSVQPQSIRQLQAIPSKSNPPQPTQVPSSQGQLLQSQCIQQVQCQPANLTQSQLVHITPQPVKHFQLTSGAANISPLTQEEQTESPLQPLQPQQALSIQIQLAPTMQPPVVHPPPTSPSEASTSPLISEKSKRLQHQPVQPRPAPSTQSQLVHVTQQPVAYSSLTSSSIVSTPSHKPEESTGSQPTLLKPTKDSHSLKFKSHNSQKILISNQILLHLLSHKFKPVLRTTSHNQFLPKSVFNLKVPAPIESTSNNPTSLLPYLSIKPIYLSLLQHWATTKILHWSQSPLPQKLSYSISTKPDLPQQQRPKSPHKSPYPKQSSPNARDPPQTLRNPKHKGHPLVLPLSTLQTRARTAMETILELMVALPREDPLFTELETLSDTIYAALTSDPDLLPILLKNFHKMQLLAQALQSHLSHSKISNSPQQTASSDSNITILPTQLPTPTSTLSNTSDPPPTPSPELSSSTNLSSPHQANINNLSSTNLKTSTKAKPFQDHNGIRTYQLGPLGTLSFPVPTTCAELLKMVPKLHSLATKALTQNITDPSLESGLKWFLTQDISIFSNTELISRYLSYLSDPLITNPKQAATFSPSSIQPSTTTMQSASLAATVSLATASNSSTKDPPTKFSPISFTQQFPPISKNNWRKQMNKLLNFVNELPSPVSLSIATISSELLSQPTKDRTTSLHSAILKYLKTLPLT